MRVLTITLLLVGAAFASLSAQSYQPTAVDGRQMFVYSGSLMTGRSTQIYRIKKDTADPSGDRFLLLLEDTTGLVQDTTAYLFEDTTAQTLTIDYQYDTLRPNYVLYYGLQPGDSVQIPAFAYPDSSNWLVVDSITTFLDRNNTARQHFHGRVVGPYNFAYHSWVEGLGSFRGLAYPYPIVRVIAEGGAYLTCVYDGNILIYSDLQSGENCYMINLPEQAWSQTQLFPQPAAQSLTIESPRRLQRYQVHNGLGQPITEGTFPAPPYRLSTQEWAAGIYFLRLWDAQGRATVRRFTVR
ncbi:MAG: hypothetical protein RI842_10170 [Schleiferiaceae bacterium]|nr:hypothetical protein [Schleiferiaceae bacterium]MDR9443074.1 hypothetical protein [Schleiferiaceae bacterium]